MNSKDTSNCHYCSRNILMMNEYTGDKEPRCIVYSKWIGAGFPDCDCFNKYN